MLQSTALEINLASYHVDVEIDSRYEVFQEVFRKYYGLMEGLTTFLKELCHPRRNQAFIVGEARGYALNYFHLIKPHDRGPEAVALFADIFLAVIEESREMEIRGDAADNLILFLQKVAKDAGTDAIGRYLPVINDIFGCIAALEDESFFLFVKSYFRLERLGEILVDYSPDMRLDFAPANRLFLRYYRSSYAYWLSEDNPMDWFLCELGEECGLTPMESVFDGISHSVMQENLKQVETIAMDDEGDSPESRELLRLGRLLALPGFNAIVDRCRKVPRALLENAPDKRSGNQWKVIFLFHIMNLSGLSLVHEDALRDINRTLSWLITNEHHSYIENLLRRTFTILKNRTAEFPATALNCVLNMGKGVYETDESDLIQLFIQSVIDLGFQTPRIQGVGNDWQIRANSAHILNIRAWLELVELNPKWSTPLLSTLIIHLALFGVFIRDTDLFPRDITRLLNSDIRPVYNLVKQLCRLFPVYFNDIGAEGDLRDISTRIDEATSRRDKLVHFLRKQVHVEGSSRVVDFTGAVLRFWATGDKSHVENFVPPSIYEQLAVEGPYIDGVHRIFSSLRPAAGLAAPEELLLLSDKELESRTADIPDTREVDRERAVLGVRLYRLLHQKYRLVMSRNSDADIKDLFARLKNEKLPPTAELEAALTSPDLPAQLDALLVYLEELKELILSSEIYGINENIYKKRHFTVDIPSMYGYYHEVKFDALGLTFRLESLVNICFDEIVDRLDLTLITRRTFSRVRDLLRRFQRALRLDGILSVEMEGQLEVLDHALAARGFTFTQYLDIFKGLARAVKNAMNDYFNNSHKNNLARILRRLAPGDVLDRYIRGSEMDDPEDVRHRISEIFFRERIAASLGLPQLDLLLTRIMNSLYNTQSYHMPAARLRLLLNYDPRRAIMSIDNPEDDDVGIIHLGNKGNNLVRLTRMGLPVPPGFTITTEVFRCWQVIEEFPPARNNFRCQVRRQIKALERMTGKRFGDPSNPLLFSVRSGSTISQPGMMDTFLNVGMNEEIAGGLAAAAGNQWFAWDNYRRFIQCMGMALGISRDEFDAIMSRCKQQAGIQLKREMSGEEMRRTALEYKSYVEKSGYRIPDDPFEQLLMTVRNVIRSWQSEKARVYRRIMGISDDWGTAVTVQTMIYGNLSAESGTGVFFTHNPRWSEDSLRLWGDFSLGNQGEDVVAGLVETLPISISQQENEKRDTDIILEHHLPEVYKTLKEWAGLLIFKHGWSPQEIEFTFERPEAGHIYMLQTRNMAIREHIAVRRFSTADAAREPALLGNGIGVSGGAMSGRVVFTLEEIDEWRKAEPDTRLILIRGDTVPDDIREINASDGLLTARGGVTSHASVVAHRLGKTCVVGCAKMLCDEAGRSATFDDLVIRSGDYLSIDGQEGVVYEGFMKVEDGDGENF
ncbi:MAG: pyruvate, phosphate dikinase [Desulfobacterales bacterium]|nr:MAG: pyruvate, phosphate dikinase [Desulfobacterales bacterium]